MFAVEMAEKISMALTIGGNVEFPVAFSVTLYSLEAGFAFLSKMVVVKR
jgi:hypothetical protein